jgi:ribonuclease D
VRRLALDTEADSLHAYPEKLCLLQISLAETDALIDPLASLDLDPLLTELKARRLVLHGADYDLRMMFRTYEFVPMEVFDTMLAARLLGHEQFGLTHLVEGLLGVRLEKGPQTADWAKRPLTDRMVNYARNDTKYLLRLADLLEERLEAKGRTQWLRESCDRLINDCAQTNEPDPNQVWRIKGASRLDRRGLAVVREVWHWRDRTARSVNKPPYFILPHETVVAISGAALRSESFTELIPRRFGDEWREGLSSVIREALSLPAESWPSLSQPQVDRLTEAEKKRVEELKKRRDRTAAELEIDPTLIASRATLTTLARRRTRDDAGLMKWQQELLGV